MVRLVAVRRVMGSTVVSEGSKTELPGCLGNSPGFGKSCQQKINKGLDSLFNSDRRYVYVAITCSVGR
jgi:hypothetical protein